MGADDTHDESKMEKVGYLSRISAVGRLLEGTDGMMVYNYHKNKWQKRYILGQIRAIFRLDFA